MSRHERGPSVIQVAMNIIKDTAEMRTWAEETRARGLKIGFVPTMGFLHEGHLSLMRHARGICDRLVVSIFVNPKQFGPHEDLQDYPRDLERDKALMNTVGVDLLFHPAASAMYGPGFQTRVLVTEVTKGMCGAFRPDFFPGVATVVLKLFNLVRPHVAVFGEKDYQQLITIRRLARDLDLDVEVLGRPTVREADGLAMSSRNTYLTPEQRQSALSLSQSLARAQDLVDAGEDRPEVILARVREHIDAQPHARVQYAVLADPEDLIELDGIQARMLLALAVHVGKARLIDNRVLTRE